MRLFGTDGIRGIAGEPPLTRTGVRAIARAAGEIFQRKAPGSAMILIGRDPRTSGLWISRELTKGFLERGLNVRDVGVVSTPALAFLVRHLRAAGGAMVSASHNPAEFNGIKFFSGAGCKLADREERQIEEWTASPGLMDRSAKETPRGKRRLDLNAVRLYEDFLTGRFGDARILKGMKLVVDCSNGSLSKIAPRVLKRLGARVAVIGGRPNGKNINLGVGSQHPEKLRRDVVRRRADAGIAFDGDGDRVIFCDPRGFVLDGDYLIAYAALGLKKHALLKGNTVVLTVMANLGMIRLLKESGIQVAIVPVGDRFVSEEMRRTGAVLGGEQSGHIIFGKLLPTGDGLLTAIQILAQARAARTPISFLTTLFNKYPQVLVNVKVKERRPVEQCPALSRRIESVKNELGENGRVLVRYSGTEPLLRVMVEGREREVIERCAAAIVSAIGEESLNA